MDRDCFLEGSEEGCVWVCGLLCLPVVTQGQHPTVLTKSLDSPAIRQKVLEVQGNLQQPLGRAVGCAQDLFVASLF